MNWRNTNRPCGELAVNWRKLNWRIKKPVLRRIGGELAEMAETT